MLLLFSLGYAVVRTIWPPRATGPRPLRAWHLVAAAAGIAVASYLLRLWVPFGEERWHVAVGQAPGWVVGFTLGVLGAERGWFRSLEPTLVRKVRHRAWVAVAACVGMVGFVGATGADLTPFAGGGTWQSLLLATVEGATMVTMSVWLLDLFQRRFNRQGRLARELSRAAYATFLVHQIVLVGLVLASRYPHWPPEVSYVTVSVLGVVLSFALGAAVVRLPGVSRIL